MKKHNANFTLIGIYGINMAKNTNIAFINELVENWHEIWYVCYKITGKLQ